MSKPIPILKRHDFLRRGQFLHVARTVLDPDTERRIHTHADFAEVFWIERGEGAHLVNNHRVPIAAGDVVLLRRRDVHGFSVASNSQISLVNVAFDDRVLADLRARYFSRRPFAWKGGAVPTMVRLSAVARERLSHWADSFSPAVQSRLELEGFLIDLLRVVSLRPVRNAGQPLPPWLRDALTRPRQSRRPLDVPALVALTGRSREHLNRTIRRCVGQTTTDFLNDLRMEFAAQQLRMTNRTITQIAFDCGLFNLAHFYRLFRSRHHTTPRRFRLREHVLLP